jgi:hypothetical protein
MTYFHPAQGRIPRHIYICENVGAILHTCLEHSETHSGASVDAERELSREVTCQFTVEGAGASFAQAGTGDIY